MSGRRLLVSSLLLFLLSMVGPGGAAVAAPAAEAERVVVPGGTESVARLLDGVDPRPEAFFLSLNDRLLKETDADHEWKDVAARVVLVHYLEDLEELRERFPPPLELSLEGAGKKQVRKLAKFLGYDVEGRGRAVAFVAGGGEKEERRRRLGRALGWDLPSLSPDLAAGRDPTLQVVDDEVPLPLTLGEWYQATGGREAGSLDALARDQRISFLIAARERLARDARELVGELGWNWWYRKQPVPLYRYASAIETRDGRLLLPGGEGSAAAWREIVDVGPERPAEMLRELFDRKNARPAFLWHALYFLRPEVARFYLGSGASETAGERRFARRVYRRLDEVTRAGFDTPRGGDLGFGTFARSVPLTEDATAFDLPGGPGTWMVAIRGADPPADLAGLARLAGKARRHELEEGEFLLRALTEEVDVGGYHRPALPRLIRTANLFRGRPDLLDTGNVLLIARAVDTTPAALELFDDFIPSEPPTVRETLLTVARLDRLSRDAEAELLTLSFQGGVEWIAAMARAGRADAAWLEERLVAWARLHRQRTDPHDVAPAQLDWIRSVLTGLPAAVADAPGRGPLERAMIASLVGFTDPQEFSFDDLPYRGERGGDLAASIAAHLEHQGIPSGDLLVRMDEAFGELRRACAAGDVEVAASLAAELSVATRRLGGEGLSAQIADSRLAERLAPVDREQALRLLGEVASQRTAKKLPRLVDEVERAEGLMARELRPFLLAPAYVTVMAGGENLLYGDPRLVRKHLLFATLDRPDRALPMWGPPGVELSDPSLGARLTGPPSRLVEALAEFALGRGGSVSLRRDRTWFTAVASGPWRLLRPEVSRLVATLVEAGGEVVDSALAELVEGSGPHLEMARRRIPLARLEADAADGDGPPRVGPSERLLLGLDLLSAGAGTVPSFSATDLVVLEEATVAVGPEWRRGLDAAGVASSALDGRGRPHVSDWPPYEAVDNELLGDAVIERQLVDLKIALVAWMGRRGLPGVAGRDVMMQLLEGSAGEVAPSDPRDWQEHLTWLASLDDERLDSILRRCFEKGLYSLSF